VLAGPVLLGECRVVVRAACRALAAMCRWLSCGPVRRRAGVAAARNRTSQAALEHEDVKSPGRIRVVSCE